MGIQTIGLKSLGLRKPKVGGGFSWSTYWTTQGTEELIAYTAGLTTDLSRAQKLVLTDFVKALKTGLEITNLSDYFDAIYLLAGETEESSYKNLTEDDHHCTAVAAPTWTQFQGIQGNGTTQYLNTNYNPATEGENYKQNDCMVGVYSNTDLAQDSRTDIGAVGGGVNLQFNAKMTGGQTLGRINTGNNPAVYDAEANSLGMFMLGRNGNNEAGLFGYHDKAALAGRISAADLTNGVPANNIFISGWNLNGNLSAPSTRQLAFAFVSKFVTTTHRDIICDAFTAYLNATLFF